MLWRINSDILIGTNLKSIALIRTHWSIVPAYTLTVIVFGTIRLWRKLYWNSSMSFINSLFISQSHHFALTSSPTYSPSTTPLHLHSHTHYFSCVLLALFGEAESEAVQEQITRVLLERLIVHRPHPVRTYDCCVLYVIAVMTAIHITLINTIITHKLNHILFFASTSCNSLTHSFCFPIVPFPLQSLH